MKTNFNVAEVALSYRNSVPYDQRTKITGAKDAYRILRKLHDDNTIDYTETFKVLYLNQANHVLGYKIVSEGGLTSTYSDIRTIMQGALLTNAVAMIIADNHPSGNVTPSEKDIQITSQINKAAQLLDLQLLDHIIYTRETYFSFADDGCA
jgi:DNA repair protein RadC